MTRSLWLLCAVTWAACAGGNSRGDRLMNDLRAFHEGIRWRRYDQAADFVPLPARDRFMAGREALDDDLRVADYEIERVKWRGDRDVTVQVRYTWHLDSRGVVHETVVEESWFKAGKGWILQGEERKRGEPMPEPPPDDAGPAAASRAPG